MSTAYPLDGRRREAWGAGVVALARALRSEGVPVGVDRVVQALHGLDAVGTDDRETVRSTLAATLLTASTQRAIFDRLFERLIPDASAAVQDPQPDGAIASPAGSTPPGGEVSDDATEALPPEAEVGSAARRSVAGTPPLRMDGAALAAGDGGGQRPTGDVTVAARYAGLELLDLEGAIDEVDLYRAVRRLAELSATRPGRWSTRGGRGRVDLRATIRRSLSTGGLLADPILRARRRDRPRLVLLTDVSGSMGQAARLALLVCHAFSRHFSSVRTYAFVNTMRDVSRCLQRGSADEGIERAVDAVVAGRSAATSDYGAALASLWPDHVAALDERATVVIFGDARTNFRPPNAELLDDLRARVAEVLWLNPEPRAYWGLGDSAADVYAPRCDAMVECRRIDQLVEVVSDLAANRRRPR